VDHNMCAQRLLFERQPAEAEIDRRSRCHM
jgi:hypothetical protein